MAGRLLAQFIIAGTQIVGRAFLDAYRQAIAKSASGGAQQAAGAAESAIARRAGLTLDEAAKILNVEKKSPPSIIQKHFDHLFKSNDPNQGGSFYLQSKVVRAKERFEQELNITIQETPPVSSPPSSSSSSSS